jgi:hypothetical protein
MGDQFGDESERVWPVDRRVQSTREQLVERVAREFREMAGLSLTERQACRLFSMSPDTCDRVFRQLEERGRVTMKPDGVLARPDREPQ